MATGPSLGVSSMGSRARLLKVRLRVNSPRAMHAWRRLVSANRRAADPVSLFIAHEAQGSETQNAPQPRGCSLVMHHIP